MNKNRVKLKVENEDAGKRIDVFVAEKLEKNRNYVQKLMDGGLVTIDGKAKKSGYKVKDGNELFIDTPEIKVVDLEPYYVDLDIIYEDDCIVVINKPAGMVVHPGQGDTHSKDSLVNALLAHCDDLKEINDLVRPGIVHRLDKDTSGVLVVAKDEKSMAHISNQFKERTVRKKYQSLVVGRVEPAEAAIDSPIGRDMKHRKKMAIRDEKQGRSAVTKYIVKEYFNDYSLLDVYIETGRTHQIRVHLEAIGFPVVGDSLYGKTKVNKKIEQLTGLKRQFLHASEIEIVHPKTGKLVKYSAELPDDLKRVLDLI